MAERISTVHSFSDMAENLIPSEIIKLANEINSKIQAGRKIHNLTIGDFDPAIFPIPANLRDEIIRAYQQGHTNYPMANGMPVLRQSVAHFIEAHLGLSYSAEEILIAGGSRPLIYSFFKTVIDPGDVVVYPVPSWNNNHYCHLSEAKGIPLEMNAGQNFMPTSNQLERYVKEATLIALCSPQNPTGTVFSRDELMKICQMVKAENERRRGVKKPLYIMYDQMYWQLTFGNFKHEDPVNLLPSLRDYVLYVDGISKAYAATGVRVGWSFGPKAIIDKMRAILSHVGAWAPKAEQIATAHFLSDDEGVEKYMAWLKPEIEHRLYGLYRGFQQLKSEGYPVDVIHPQAAIYLTVSFPWRGMKTKAGQVLHTQDDVTSNILENCGVAIVPFPAFGASKDSPWYRISVGTLPSDSISEIIESLKRGMDQLVT